MSSHWIAASLLFFKDGTVYGKVEMTSLHREVVEAFVRKETQALGALELPPFLHGKKPVDFMVYSLEMPDEHPGQRLTIQKPRQQ